MKRLFVLFVVAALFLDAVSGTCLAAGQSGGSQGGIPTVDDILNSLGGNKDVNIDNMASGVIIACLKFIRFLQTLAVPAAIILIIVAIGMFAAGTLGHNDALKRQAAGVVVGTALGFIIVRLAPVLVAGMLNATK